MKDRIKNIIKTIVFIIVICFIAVHLTYILRRVSYSRDNVGGISREGDLDIVCIGGSSTAVYWKPLYAWKEYGMLSYDYATSAYRMPVTIGAVKDVLAKKDPKLLVLDMRPFTYGDEGLEDAEQGIRNMADSMDFGVNRLLTVKDALEFYGADIFDKENLSFFVDLIKYHTNTEALGKEKSWEHVNNNAATDNKGFQFSDEAYNIILPDPGEIEAEKRQALEPEKEAYLRRLLDYLKTQDVDVLFVVSPAPMSELKQEKNNYIGDIVDSYGYKFLNTNLCYEEMGIDFAKDFYDTGHVNVYGADKYTKLVGEYIRENYDIPDRSLDDKYASEWNEAYEAFLEKDIETKALVDEEYNSNVKAAAE